MTIKKHRATRGYDTHAHMHRNREDDGTAFIADPYRDSRQRVHAYDPLAEELAEEFVASATGAEEVGAEMRDQVFTEEAGGPFVETTGAQEFASGTDASNPLSAERAPFPTATRATRR
jgi:hypothetical protein